MPSSPARSRRSAAPLLAALLALPVSAGCSTRAFFFHPTRDLHAEPGAEDCAREEVRIPAADGSLLHGWLLSPRSGPPAGSVLHLHGNRGNISDHFPSVLALVRAGFTALVFDYRGFGRSPGTPSQESILEDALTALDWMRARPGLARRPLVLFGQSLGGHLATVLAARRRGEIDAVVLEGAFTRYKDIAADTAAGYGLARPLTRLFIPERYAGLDVVDQLGVPLLVIHSRDDAVVPFAMGLRLYERAREPKRSWAVRGPHLGAAVREPERFLEYVRELLSLRPTSAGQPPLETAAPP